MSRGTNLLRRGFKSQCEKRSASIREYLNLEPDDPLSASELSTNFGTTVWSERNIRDVADHDIAQLTRRDAESWSAFTMRVEENHLIVFNSSQSAPRQNSVIMHELAHIILGHELTSASLTDDGHFVPTTYNQDQEDEADWLAGALLLPRPALLKIRQLGMTDQTAMDTFMVSQQMLTWRFRMTGVDYQLASARRKWAR